MKPPSGLALWFGAGLVDFAINCAWASTKGPSEGFRDQTRKVGVPLALAFEFALALLLGPIAIAHTIHCVTKNRDPR